MIGNAAATLSQSDNRQFHNQYLRTVCTLRMSG